MNKVILEDTGCPLGCPRDDEPVLVGRDRIHALPGRFAVVRCKSCGLMRTNPRPTQDSIGLYYPEDYGPYLGTRVSTNSSQEKEWIKKVLRPIYTRVLEFNTTRLPKMPPGRMLEIGCASGAFLHKMAVRGWTVEGIEFSPSAAEAAARLGYKIFRGPVEKAPAPASTFDLIVGWMVLEHLHEPILALKKLRSWIKPDGWLVISVPNAGSFEFTIFKDRWYALQLPCHLYHFTPKTIGLVLDKAGWEMKKIHHHRTLTNLFASLGHLMQDYKYEKMAEALIKLPEKAGLLNAALYPLGLILGLLGQTGRMTVWARPKG